MIAGVDGLSSAPRLIVLVLKLVKGYAIAVYTLRSPHNSANCSELKIKSSYCWEYLDLESTGNNELLPKIMGIWSIILYFGGPGIPKQALIQVL